MSKNSTVLQPKLAPARGPLDFIFRHPAATSFLATSVFFAAFLAILRPGYGTDDDIQMIATVAGYMGGKAFPFLIWSNDLLGTVLSFFYASKPTINWEIWLFVAVHFFSIWALIELIVSRSMTAGIKAFGVLVILFGDAYFLLNLTYTTVSAIGSISGFCLLLTAAQSPRMLKGGQFFFAIVLIVVGSLVRLESTGLVLAIMIPGLIVCRGFFPIRNLGVAIAMTAALVLACYAIRLAYLRLFPDWNNFYIYAVTRSMLQDTPRLANVDGRIRDVHWTTNDLNMFARWFFPDAQTYSLQNLQYLVGHVSTRRPTILNRLLLFSRHLLDETILPYTLLVLLTWMGLLFHGFASKKVVISACLTLLVTLAINGYLLWTIRLPDYVLLSSLEASAIFTLFIGYWTDSGTTQEIRLPETSNPTDQKSDFHGPRQGLLSDGLAKLGRYASVILLLVVLTLTLDQSIKTTYTNLTHEAVYHQMLTEIGRLPLQEGAQKPLIISPAFGIPWEWSNPLTVDFPETHYMILGWDTLSPAYQNVLAQYQVGTLPAGLYDAKNVYLMTDATTLNGIVLFIKNHGGVNVTSRLIYTPNFHTGTIYDTARLYKLERQP
jgi:hypothetical protein